MSATEHEIGDKLREREGRKVSEAERRTRKRLIDFGKSSKTHSYSVTQIVGS